MGRYQCSQGKVTGIAKANRVCLIKRCPNLLVRYKNKSYKKVFPIGLVDNAVGC